MSSASSLEQQLQELLVLLRDVQSAHSANVAALTVYIYDYLLTSGEEYEYVWKARWSLGKVLFLWNRYFYLAFVAVDLYFNLQNNVSDHICKIWSIAHPTLIVLLSICIEFLLSYRVWVLYQKSRTIAALLIGIFVVETLAIIGLSIRTLLLLGVLPRPGPFLAGCFPTNIPSWFWVVFIPPAVASICLFVLIAAKTVSTVGACRQVAPLMTVFLRDGVVYFALISVTLSVNVILYLVTRPVLASAGYGFCYTIPPLLASRIILNVRSCHPKQAENLFNYVEPDVSMTGFVTAPYSDVEIGGQSRDLPHGVDNEVVEVRALHEVIIQ